MGFMWINKNVKVNCEKNYENNKRLTLVDNKYGEAHDFSNSSDVLKYLLDVYVGSVEYVDSLVDNLVEEKFNKEQEDRKWRTYNFFAKKGSAPYIINSIDSSEHVKSWRILDDVLFDGMVQIEYVADKQVLIQCADGVVIEL